MKNFIVAAAGILLTQSSFASCVDLTGNYTLVDTTSVLNLVVTQDQCKTVELLYNEAMGKIYTTNNVTYLTNDNDEMKVFESSSINDQELIGKVEFYYKAKDKSTTAVSHMYLDAAGDLHGEYDYYDYNGALYHQDKPYFKRNP